MFGINDVVVYKSTEICRIQEIKTMSFMGQENIEYYVLSPVYDESAAHTTLYVPTNADEATLRSLLTADELLAMLHAPAQEISWISNAAFRRKEYAEILSEGSPVRLLALLRTLNKYRARKPDGTKKFTEFDEKTLKSAERRLYPLFHHVLGLSPEQFQQAVYGNPC